MAEPWPLVGRDAELQFATELLGSGRGVVVAGAAGVGKTRLLLELCAALPDEKWHVERVTGTPAGATLPLASFAFLDDSAARDTTLFDSPLAAARLELVRRAEGRQLLLAVDDAHHLDEASAALVHQLAVAGDIVVVMTLRTSEPAPAAVVALWKDEHCERVELQPIARGEVDELLERVLAGRVDPEARLALWEASQGNLLFLRELVRDGLRREALHHDGMWRWTQPSDPPATVRELIGQQVHDLDASARLALEYVALAEPLEWDLLVGMAGAPAADALVDANHLVVATDDRRLFARFSHPLIGEVVRAAIPVSRRRRLYRALADAMPSPGRRRPDTLRRVTWLVAAEEPVAVDELLLAAREVMLLDPERAARFASLAREADDDNEDAIVVLAQTLMFGRRAEEADRVLEAALERKLEDDARVALSNMRANNLTYGLVQPAAAIAVLDELRPTIASDPVLTRKVDAQRLTMLFFASRVPELLQESESFLADDALEPADRMRVLMTVVPAHAASGRTGEALAIAEGARELIPAVQNDLPYALGQLAAGALLALQWSGRIDEADAIARFGYEDGTRRHAQLLRGVSAMQLGLGAYWRGTMQTAARYFEEAVAALRHADVGFLPSACDHLVAVRAITGSFEAPDAVVEDSARFPLYETERLRLAAVTAAGRGDLRSACDLAAHAAEVAGASGLTMHVLFAHWDRARYGEAALVQPAVSALAASCDGALAPVLATAVDALVADDGDALERSASDLGDLGFLLWSAELERAAAQSFDRAGLRARAVAADARAESRLAECEGASTPMVRRPDRDRPELTRREREIAELAATDLTNGQIAARLNISIRTVETHLQHAYDKLGVSSRQDLAAALGHRPT